MHCSTESGCHPIPAPTSDRRCWPRSTSCQGRPQAGFRRGRTSSPSAGLLTPTILRSRLRWLLNQETPALTSPSSRGVFEKPRMLTGLSAAARPNSRPACPRPHRNNVSVDSAPFWLWLALPVRLNVSTSNYGLSDHELTRIRRIIEAHKNELRNAWRTFFGR